MEDDHWLDAMLILFVVVAVGVIIFATIQLF